MRAVTALGKSLAEGVVLEVVGEVLLLVMPGLQRVSRLALLDFVRHHLVQAMLSEA